MSFARTEDGFVVYTLYMGSIPKNFTKQILQTHFSRYGEVSVEILFSGNKRMRYALIKFKNPESATRALTTKIHHFTEGTRYVYKVVKAAYSWLQPNFEDKLEIDSDSLILLMLNDDCLLHIFSFLSTRERIRLSFMNERFKQLFKITNIHKKSVSLSNLTLMEVRYICREFGQLIQDINFEWSSDLHTYRVCKYVASYCCELRSLKYTNLSIGEDINFRFMKHLTKITLRNCNISDTVIFHLSKMQNLTHLDVKENSRLTGRHLNDFPELTYLNLYKCTGIKKAHFFAFCASKRIIENLKSLNLTIFGLRSYFFEKLDFLKNLERLVVTSSIDFGLLSDIKKLKHLIINVETTRRQIHHFPEKCFTGLETLFIIEMDINVVATDINHIFLLKNLKKLGLIRCYNLEDEHMAKIAAMPELTYLDISGCNIHFNGFLELFKKPNKLQYVNISQAGFPRIFMPLLFPRVRPFLEVVREKMVETGRTAHCTLYFNGEQRPNQILEVLPWLTIVQRKYVLPGMKLCYDYYTERLEFED